MLCRIALACLALTLAAGPTVAQVSLGTTAIPARRSLARVNLDMQWHGVVPLTGAEKLVELSIDAGMLFAQTNHANFYAFEAETGRYLWAAHLGRVTIKAEPAAVNSFAVYVTNSNTLFAFDRQSGREIWTKRLSDPAASATNADDSTVMVGLNSGSLLVLNARTGADMFHIQANQRISSRPLMAGRVLAFGSEDKKLYVSLSNKPKLLWRFAAGGPIEAPISSYGLRTLIVPSIDKSVYAVDLFTGQLRWTFGTGAAVKQEPIVADKDIYIVNEQGSLSEIDAETGLSRWTISTLGGRLLAVSETRLYLESHDDDLFVVDRQSGKMVYDPLTTSSRAGINLRDYNLGPTNRLDDRLYFGSAHGLLLCLRESNQLAPRMIRNPNMKPLGYIPPEGYPEGASPGGPTPPPADPNETPM